MDVVGRQLLGNALGIGGEQVVGERVVSAHERHSAEHGRPSRVTRRHPRAGGVFNIAPAQQQQCVKSLRRQLILQAAVSLAAHAGQVGRPDRVVGAQHLQR